MFTAANAVGLRDQQPGAGTAWPVIHQQLGVRPSLGTRRLEVVPNVPAGQPRIGGANIRRGDGAVAVQAEHHGRRYTTTVTLSGRSGVERLYLGVTLPAGRVPKRVRINGRRPKRATFRETRRGLEVVVTAGTRGRQVLTVEAG